MFGDEDGQDGVAAGGGVEIVQVDRVIFHLAAIGRGVGGGAGFKFEDEDGTVGQQDSVRAPADAEHWELQHDVPSGGLRERGERCPQHRQAGFPGAQLLCLVDAEMAYLRGSQGADDGVGRRGQQLTDGAGPERAHAGMRLCNESTAEHEGWRLGKGF